MKKSKCINCQKRKPACSDTCKTFAEEKLIRQVEKDNRRSYYEKYHQPLNIANMKKAYEYMKKGMR